MNRTGFQNLTKLSSKAFLEGFYYKPRIDKELLQAHNEGIICLSGCASSELSRALLGNELEKAQKLGVKIVDEAEYSGELREQSRQLRLKNLYSEGKITEEEYNYYLANSLK